MSFLLLAGFGYDWWYGVPFNGSAPPARIRSAIRIAGADQLRNEARLIAQKYGTNNLPVAVSDQEGALNLPTDAWPAGVKALHPLRIELHYDRLSLVMDDSESFYAEVEIYFVEDFPGPLMSKGDAQFADGSSMGGGSHESEYKIVHGIHWLTAKPHKFYKK